MVPVIDKIQAVQSYFKTGATISREFRLVQLKKIRQYLLDNEAAINTALYQDLHKSVEEVWITEIGMALAEVNYAINNLKQWMRPKPVATNLLNFPGKSVRIPEPLGVVFIIGPWNYPFQLILTPLIGAIAAGNCVVVKPSEQAIHTEKLITDIIYSLFSDNYVFCLAGDGKAIIPPLMERFRFDHVFFTGSTAVGKSIYQLAAAKLTPVTLELGGKSPCIVTPDANIKVAAKRIAFAKFSNAGQMCITVDYVLVHTSKKQALLTELQNAIQQFLGNDAADSPDFGRIINDKQFNRLLHLIKDQTIIYGGQTDSSQLYIAPTLIDGADTSSPIMQEEIFGPLLPILTYTTKEEALDIIAQNPNPLAFYIFTDNKREADEWLNSVAFGGGCVNHIAMHFTNKNLPFGGRGASGLGRYHGKFSFETFSHFKSVVKAKSWFDLPMQYPPFKGKLKLLKRIIK